MSHPSKGFELKKTLSYDEWKLASGYPRPDQTNQGKANPPGPEFDLKLSMNLH